MPPRGGDGLLGGAQDHTQTQPEGGSVRYVHTNNCASMIYSPTVQPDVVFGCKFC